PDQHNGYGDTDRSHSDVSGASQRNQIGIVLVEADEQESQRKGPQQRSADSFDHLAEPPREVSRIRNNLPRNGRGHVVRANNPPCTTSAKNTCSPADIAPGNCTGAIHSSDRNSGDRFFMPIPSRLANDGWWLCDGPPIAPVVIPFPNIQGGSASMMNLAQPESAIAPARINIHVVRVAAAIGLAALADWLFYDEYA